MRWTGCCAEWTQGAPTIPIRIFTNDVGEHISHMDVRFIKKRIGSCCLDVSLDLPGYLGVRASVAEKDKQVLRRSKRIGALPSPVMPWLDPHQIGDAAMANSGISLLRSSAPMLEREVELTPVCAQSDHQRCFRHDSGPVPD